MWEPAEISLRVPTEAWINALYRYQLVSPQDSQHHEEQGSSLLQMPGRIWSTVHRSIFQAPKGILEATWRVVSISMVTGFLTSGFMVWRFPNEVRNLIQGDQIENEIILDIFRRDPETEERAMDMIASFVAHFAPSHIALINWETQTGIHEVWASGTTRFWPTATDGVMHPNMAQVLGYLIFDECWVGSFETDNGYGRNIVSGENWLICGLSNEHDLWGYVMVHWDGDEVPPSAVAALRVLSARLESVIFH